MSVSSVLTTTPNEIQGQKLGAHTALIDRYDGVAFSCNIS